MSSSSASSLHVVYPQEGEAWNAFTQRLLKSDGEILLILSGREIELIAQPEVRTQFLTEAKKIRQRVRIATKHPAIAAEARSHGFRVLDRTKHVRTLLHGHPKLNEAMRMFSPQLWRQQLKSQLQRMGLLSVPKIRIFSLAGLSVLLFYIVVFKLLPSADVYVKPRQEAVSQTVNIFLVQSGATVQVSDRVRRMPLIPFTIKMTKKMNFEHISKEFIGQSSKLQMTVINKAGETYSLRPGTRFSNQAGMIFRILDYAIVDAGKEVTVRAEAEDLDLYGQIIGDRGNVPSGLKWEIPGLSAEERPLVYGENRSAGVGGTTAYRTVLRQEDLDLAQKRLEQELLAAAKIEAEKRQKEYNAEHPGQYLTLLIDARYDALIKLTYNNIVLPTDSIGKEVNSVPIEGSIDYTIFAYDADAILAMLLQELKSHVREGRQLIDDQLERDHMVAHVIDYDDALTWIKLTVDLTGTEEYILDPLSPTGALFGKNVREKVAGQPREDALRILRNMPEVERVEVKQWPPWQSDLPNIPSHISVVPY